MVYQETGKMPDSGEETVLRGVGAGAKKHTMER